MFSINTDDNKWYTSELGIGHYDGTDIILPGPIMVVNGLTKGFNYYVQTNGSISKTITSRKVGYAIADNHLVVLGNGNYGIDEAYVVPVKKFNAHPSITNEIWLEIEKDENATGVLVKKSNSPYDGSGIDWGTTVIDITDDTPYHGEGNFYKDTTATLGQRTYYKAFQYFGSLYNVVQGQNESDCYCRNGTGFWSFNTNDVSGATIINRYLGADFTASNISYTQQIKGNGAYINDTTSYIRTTPRFIPRTGDHTYVVWTARPTSGVNWILCEASAHDGSDGSTHERSYGWQIGIDSTGDFVVEYGTGLAGSWGTYNIPVGVDANTHMFAITFGDSGITIHIDKEVSSYSGQFSYGSVPSDSNMPIKYTGIGIEAFNDFGGNYRFDGCTGQSYDQLDCIKILY